LIRSGIEILQSEVIGRCGGDEKTEWPRRTDKKSSAECCYSITKFGTITVWHNTVIIL